ncbi:hypothetical protein I5M32_07280 [Pedobacter sp. SD-b]|uniref:Uncharacterized protein n=1 Tax=Pedobacter segetis TaxID=2793069 RepID=A0ABS1BIP8_9SPHI|nr:hypothetical protein [Pedobacter segetis]MBK0382758.1 hypothetical protein [Pedobacter segetis]
MTTIIANIPNNLKSTVKKFIEEIGGEIISEKEVNKLTVLKDLEEAFLEAKQIRDGKKEGYTLKEILNGK